MQELAGGVKGTLGRLGWWRVEDGAAVITDGFEEHSEDPALLQMRLFVPDADHLSAQGMEVVAVYS